MASASVKSNRMKRIESKKSHSWWWDSHISPKNSKWLQENLEEMNQHVKRMLLLIETDADSFAKKAEMFLKKRPELISLVEEFYRMYRSLAEKYDHVTGELKKNIPSDLHSQSSGISDAGSEPPSTKSGPRAAGFDFFLGSGSDLNSNKGDESSTLDSESESDDSSSVNNYSGPHSNSVEEKGLQKKILELEVELRKVKENYEDFKKSNYENSEVSAKLVTYEEELVVAKEKIQQFDEELQKYKSLGDSNNLFLEKPEVSDWAHKIQTLEEELSITQEKLHESEMEVARLKQEFTSKSSSIQKDLQDQVKSAQKEVSIWKNKLEKEKREVSKVQDRIVRYKNNLSDRDQEIRGLKEAISNANKSLSEENEQLKSEMTRITKERTYLEDNLKELDLTRQSLEEEVRRVKAGKEEMEVILGAQIEQLKADISERDDRLEELNKKVDALNAEISSKDDEIIAIRKHLHEVISDAEGARKMLEEVGSRVEKLEMEVERKEELILLGAEEKREAIRQLCFSLEHYRDGYHWLRKAVIAHKGQAVRVS